MAFCYWEFARVDSKQEYSAKIPGKRSSSSSSVGAGVLNRQNEAGLVAMESKVPLAPLELKAVDIWAHPDRNGTKTNISNSQKTPLKFKAYTDHYKTNHKLEQHCCCFSQATQLYQGVKDRPAPGWPSFLHQLKTTRTKLGTQPVKQTQPCRIEASQR